MMLPLLSAVAPLVVSIALAGDLPRVVTPSPVRAVASATPFVLDVPYRYDWSAERPDVRAGTLLVLDVDPAALVPRNGPSPVLYVGALPAEVVGRDVAAGRLAVVVPGALPPEVYLYYAGDELPERVTAADGARALAAASSAGIAPFRVALSATVVTLSDHDALATWGAAR